MIISLKCNLFSPLHSWQIVHLAVNSNHTLTIYTSFRNRQKSEGVRIKYADNARILCLCINGKFKSYNVVKWVKARHKKTPRTCQHVLYVVEWSRALDVRLSEWCCSVSMVWVQIPSREEQKFDSSKKLNLTLFGLIFRRILRF